MNLAEIMLPPLYNGDSYMSFPNERTVRKVLGEMNSSEKLKYRVEMGAGHTETVSFYSSVKTLIYILRVSSIA